MNEKVLAYSLNDDRRVFTKAYIDGATWGAKYLKDVLN